MNDKAKARIYCRSKYTIETDPKTHFPAWIKVYVWLVRHLDGRIEECSDSSAAYTRAIKRAKELSYNG